jgi:hypothetical protein
VPRAVARSPWLSAKVPARPGYDVADEQLVAAARRAHGGGGAGDTGQGLQRGVDLAELDPAAAELDLLVGAALEEQALPGRT